MAKFTFFKWTIQYLQLNNHHHSQVGMFLSPQKVPLVSNNNWSDFYSNLFFYSFTFSEISEKFNPKMYSLWVWFALLRCFWDSSMLLSQTFICFSQWVVLCYMDVPQNFYSFTSGCSNGLFQVWSILKKTVINTYM